MTRAKRDGGSIDWVVMRNRLSNIDARNKRMIAKVTEELTKRLGFRLAPGFSERVIFRELFLLGLTVLDVVETNKGGTSLSMSHLAARQEVRDLLNSLRIPAIEARIAQVRTGQKGDVLTDPKIAPKAKTTDATAANSAATSIHSTSSIDSSPAPVNDAADQSSASAHQSETAAA